MRHRREQGEAKGLARLQEVSPLVAQLALLLAAAALIVATVGIFYNWYIWDQMSESVTK